MMGRAKVIFSDGGTLFGCKGVEGRVISADVIHSQPSSRQIETTIELNLTLLCDTDSFYSEDNQGGKAKVSRERLLRKLKL